MFQHRPAALWNQRATPGRSATCRHRIRDHIDHHMRHVVPACGGAIGILHEFQWHALSEHEVLAVRLYSLRRPLSRPGVGSWFMVPLEFAPHHQALACLVDVVASLGEGYGRRIVCVLNGHDQNHREEITFSEFAE